MYHTTRNNIPDLQVVQFSRSLSIKSESLQSLKSGPLKRLYDLTDFIDFRRFLEELCLRIPVFNFLWM